MARRGGLDPDRAVADFEARLQRSAFGDATRASYRQESAEEDAHFTAATNLLEKAVRRLADEDEAAAAALVRRALAIGPTLEDEARPAAVAAQVLLLTELTDRAEASRTGDASWLDPVLAVFARTSGPLRAEFARVLDALRQTGLSEVEERRLRGLAPAGSRLEDPLSGVDGDAERVDVLLGMLRLLADLHAV